MSILERIKAQYGDIVPKQYTELDLHEVGRVEVITHNADSNTDLKLNPNKVYVFLSCTHSNSNRQSIGFLRYYPAGEGKYIESVATTAPGTSLAGDLLEGFDKPFIVIGEGYLTFTGQNWQLGDTLTFRLHYLMIPRK